MLRRVKRHRDDGSSVRPVQFESIRPYACPEERGLVKRKPLARLPWGLRDASLHGEIQYGGSSQGHAYRRSARDLWSVPTSRLKRNRRSFLAPLPQM